MAITKQAKNIKISITKNHTTVVGGAYSETAKKVFIYSTEKDLNLVSNKKIIANGNQS
jgi:hypothetical protein